MNNTTRKITYSAVFTAIACIFMALSHLTPATVTMLVIPALCFYLALKKCGVGYGLVTVGISLLTAAAIDGFVPCASLLIAALVFVPYSLVAFLLQKLSYRVWWQGLVRVLICAALFAAASTALVFLVDLVLDTTLGALITRFRFVVIPLIAAVTLPFDFFFLYVAERVYTLLK
ncbi:MAG: hypothetical protein LBH24_03685 [Clostridiales bacterium]|jgi:hypothetical protein|nr:hypothetical protein [Clostridiales bacterium]